jgi:hypothetical protein
MRDDRWREGGREKGSVLDVCVYCVSGVFVLFFGKRLEVVEMVEGWMD